MSAIGFTILEDRIHLISDGMAMRNGKEYTRKSRKVIRIGNHAALMWMGVGCHALNDDVSRIMRDRNASTPQEIAKEMGKIMKQMYQRPGSPIHINRDQFWITAIGYDENSDVSGWLVHNIDTPNPFEAAEANLVIGGIGSMINGFDGYNASPFDRLVSKYVRSYSPKEAMRRALADCIEQANKRNGYCGGKRYYVTIKKPD